MGTRLGLGLSVPKHRAVRDIEFNAGHRVPGHKGKCRSPHGHQYKVVLVISGELQDEGSSEGMVVDFSDIKKVLQEIHDHFDHGFMYYRGDELMRHLALTSEDFEEGLKWVEIDFIPTAENIAKWCYDYASQRWAELEFGGEVAVVEVYESSTTSVLYPV